MRAFDAGAPVVLRFPGAVRPWLHVLEPLAGYLMMAQAMASRSGPVADSLNFAPAPANFRTVAALVEAFGYHLGDRSGWVAAAGSQPHEARLLTLSAERAAAQLGWRPCLDFADTVAWTAEWYREHRQGGDARGAVLRQIESYMGKLNEASTNRQRETA
jgi:CDP-glucose 4,6-dehydratase